MENQPMGKDDIFAEADKNTKAALDAAFGTGVAEEEKETDKKAEATFNIQELLSNIPGGPKAEQVTQWKSQFGDIYVLPLDFKEIYVWRPLRNLEYQNMLSNADLTKNDSLFREGVVLRALLWPKLKPEQIANTRAGLMDTLFQVIMQGSYFLSPEFALSLVQKL